LAAGYEFKRANIALATDGGGKCLYYTSVRRGGIKDVLKYKNTLKKRCEIIKKKSNRGHSAVVVKFIFHMAQ